MRLYICPSSASDAGYQRPLSCRPHLRRFKPFPFNGHQFHLHYNSLHSHCKFHEQHHHHHKSPTTTTHQCIAAVLLFLFTISGVTPKSTIEPCCTTDSCTTLLGYTLYTELKVSEPASLFQIDPINLWALDDTDNTVQHSDPVQPVHLKAVQFF